MEQVEKIPNISSPQQSTLYLQNFPLWPFEQGESLSGADSGQPLPTLESLFVTFLVFPVVEIVVGDGDALFELVVETETSSSLQS